MQTLDPVKRYTLSLLAVALNKLPITNYSQIQTPQLQLQTFPLPETAKFRATARQTLSSYSKAELLSHNRHFIRNTTQLAQPPHHTTYPSSSSISPFRRFTALTGSTLSYPLLHLHVPNCRTCLHTHVTSSDLAHSHACMHVSRMLCSFTFLLNSRKVSLH